MRARAGNERKAEEGAVEGRRGPGLVTEQGRRKQEREGGRKGERKEGGKEGRKEIQVIATMIDPF